MSARAQNAVLFTARVVFPGETASEQSVLRSEAGEILPLLLHRLEMLEAALLRLSELLGSASAEPPKQEKRT
jgi:hypothetical protein